MNFFFKHVTVVVILLCGLMGWAQNFDVSVLEHQPSQSSSPRLIPAAIIAHTTTHSTYRVFYLRGREDVLIEQTNSHTGARMAAWRGYVEGYIGGVTADRKFLDAYLTFYRLNPKNGWGADVVASDLQNASIKVRWRMRVGDTAKLQNDSVLLPQGIFLAWGPPRIMDYIADYERIERESAKILNVWGAPRSVVFVSDAPAFGFSLYKERPSVVARIVQMCRNAFLR